MTNAGRLRMTGYAALQLPLAVLALVLFIVDAVAAVLAVIVVGLPILMVSMPATRWLADRPPPVGRATSSARRCRRRTGRSEGAGRLESLRTMAVRPDDLARPGAGC